MEGCESRGGWERGEFVFCKGVCAMSILMAVAWAQASPMATGCSKNTCPGVACLGGGIRDAHACEEVGSLTVG